MKIRITYQRAAVSAAAVLGLAVALLTQCIGGAASVRGASSLKEAFKGRFLIGVAVDSAQILERDTRGVGLVRAQFNSITAENALKWERVHPAPGRYEFGLSDRFVAFGEKNNMFVVGHTLIWHNQTPQWVFEDEGGKRVTREELLARMRDHIHTVLGRYKGRIKGWDVVNEAIVDDGSFKQSPWLEIIGEEYLVKAFQFAHEADPGAELYYNDFSVENIPKRRGVIRLIRMLRDAGVKVAGIGMQGHYLLEWPTAGQLDSTINEFAALGVNVMITELDVDLLPRASWGADAEISRRFAYKEDLNPYKDGLPDDQQQKLARRYAELFRVFVKNSEKINRVTFWGVEDGNSWLNNFPVEGRTNYPLLFDREGKPKQAFQAVLGTAK
jgi:endo-1,4-beta-xylanase